MNDLIAFLDASPSPYHAVASAGALLDAAGFQRVDEADPLVGAGRAYLTRGGALVAWSAPATTPAPSAMAFRIVGAHTDSPGLRVKPSPDIGGLGWRQLGVEVYGGALLNSWLDRDLGVAGRLVSIDGDVVLVDVRDPIARVPQLAIHLDREVNERGLLLDKQQHITPVWGVGPVTRGDFASFISGEAGMDPTSLAAWDLQLFDLTPAAVLGADRSLLAAGRLDNQVSCWAATTAMIAAEPAVGFSVVALFDHEEVGSESETGAAGPILERTLERLVMAAGGGRDEYLRALTRSTCISADNAHAVHPNYPDRHDPDHRPMVNEGPALKLNASQRYATSAPTAALFERCCLAAGVPMQRFVSRNNMPCGSTIGPITSTRLGIATVDVGVPQLSMHSARELCGVDDPGYLVNALTVYFGT